MTALLAGGLMWWLGAQIETGRTLGYWGTGLAGGAGRHSGVLVATHPGGVWPVSQAWVSQADVKKGHPRIWVTREELERVRGLMSDTHKNVLGWAPAEKCGEIVARARELAEAPAYHYAVNMPGREGGPSQRWEYTLSDEPPPRHDEYSHYPPWTAMFQEGSDSITTRIKLFSFAHLVTGEAMFFEKAKEIVFHLCRWPIVWTDPSYGSGKPCLDTGHAAHAVALFYDWCYEALTAEEREFVRRSLVEKALRPIDEILDTVPDYHNYAAVVATGLGTGGLALLGEEEEAQRWVERSIEKMKRSFDVQGRDGGPLEGPGYGTYFADNYARLLWGLDTVGFQTDVWQHTFVKTMPRYCIGLMAPKVHRQPTFGDGGPTAAFPLMMTLLALRGDTDAAWYLEQIGGLVPSSVETILLLDPQRIKPQKPEWNPSVCFLDVGYASLRDGYNENGAYMAFKCGPPEKEVGHNHLDHNSFQICYNGEWIAADPGYRSYFDPPKRKYTVSAFGHNCVVLNLTPEWLGSSEYGTVGVDQVRLTRGRIDRFFSSEGYDYVRGDATQAYNTDQRQVMERAWREVLFVKPRLFVIRDWVEGVEPCTYHYMLHAAAGREIRLESSPHATIQGTNSALDAWIFSPEGITMSKGEYPGAEAYGPYLMGTTNRAKGAIITSVLALRRWTGLINGGFERGMIGWRPRVMPGFTENHVIDEEVHHSGERSGRIDAPGGYYYSNNLYAEAGARIKARFWARVQGVQGGASTCFYFWRDGKAFHREEGPAPAGDEWRQYEFEATVPEGTEEVCLALHFFAAEGRAWYDDVEIEFEPALKEESPLAVEAIGEGARGVVVTMDGTHVVLFGAGDAENRASVAGHDFEFVGEMAAASLDAAGRLKRAWLLEGTRLIVDGEEAIRLTERGTGSAIVAGE
jgi:hypothetical protein